ncbi:MAG: guanylate kinase [Myxococcota bacterium]
MEPGDLLLLIISSPSGAGKTTLTRRLLKQFPDLTFSVSHTTRPRRATEVHGKDYHFTDRPTFEAMIERDAFAEWAPVHGNLYGTSKAELERARREGRQGIVFDIDHQGARQIRATFPSAVGVFILPPSMPELLDRLRSRAEDDEDTIRRRYEKALFEIEHYPFFDYLVVNDELERADAELQGIVYAERNRRWRSAALAERLLRAGKRRG